MKKVINRTVLVLLCLSSFCLFNSCSKKNDGPKTKSTEQIKEESTRKAIIELANKYNAIINWGEPLNKKLFVSPIFTIEAEDALLRKDKRPMLFLATAKDVERKEDKYLARFIVGDLAELPTIEFILDCTEEQARKITQQQIEFFERYAVIAEIQKIRKIIFNLKAEGNSEEPEISVDTTDDVFIATGKCLDLLFVGDYYDYDISEKEKKDN